MTKNVVFLVKSLKTKHFFDNYVLLSWIANFIRSPMEKFNFLYSSVQHWKLNWGLMKMIATVRFYLQRLFFFCNFFLNLYILKSNNFFFIFDWIKIPFYVHEISDFLMYFLERKSAFTTSTSFYNEILI